MTQNKPILTKILLDDAEFKKAMGGIQGQLKTVGSKFNRIGREAAVPFAALGTTVLGASKAFGDFEASMSNVSTLIDTNTESMSKMGKEVLDIAKRTPVAVGDLTASLYDVRSAGIDAGKAMGVLETSAKLSVAGLSTSAEATNIMTSALNAFEEEGLNASQTANILFKTVKFGKTTIAELSQAFGATAPLVQSAGIQLADFSAATAALTTVGTPAAQAQNAIRAAIVALQKPTKEMSAIFSEIGVSSGQELIQTSDGIGDAFQKITAAADSASINITKAAGRVEASNAIISLAGSTNAAYTETLNSMRDGTDAVSEAFSKQSSTFNSSIILLVNRIQALAVGFGENLAPAISLASKGIGAFADLVSNIPRPLQQLGSFALLAATAVTGLVAAVGLSVGVLATGSSAILTFAGGLIGLQAEAISASAVFTGLSGVLTGALASATTTATAGFTAMAAALGVSTGGLTWVIGGVAAAVGGLAVAYANDFMGIQTITLDVVKSIGESWRRFTELFSQLVQTIGLIWQDLSTNLSQIWRSAVEKLGAIWSSFTTWLGGGIQTIANWFHSLWTNIQNLAFQAFSNVQQAGKNAFGGLVGLAKTMAESILSAFSWLTENASKLFNNMIAGANHILNAVGLPTIQKIGGAIRQGLGDALDYMTAKWEAAGQAIKAVGAAGNALEPLKEATEELGTTLDTALGTDEGSVGGGGAAHNGTKLGKLADDAVIAGESIAQLGQRVEEEFLPKMAAISTGGVIGGAAPVPASPASDSQGQTAGGPVEGTGPFSQMAASATSAFAQIGQSFTQNVVNGITNGNLDLQQSFKALAQQALSSLTKGLFDNVKKSFGEMLKNGVNTSNLLEKSFDSFSKATSGIFGGLFSVIKSVFGGMFSFIISGLRGLFSKKKKGAMGDAKRSVLQGALNTAKESANAPFPLNLVMPQISYSMYMGSFMPTVGLIGATGSFAVGTPEVPSDMMAAIHKGEMIIPATFAQAIRSGDVTLSGGKDNQSNTNQPINNFYFEGAQFVGMSNEMVEQFEEALNKKFNIMGSPLQQGLA